MTDSVARARALALRAHGDQRYGEQPYVKHLDDVAELCAPYGETAAALAYLHDVLEDTEVGRQAIVEQFDENLAWQVEQLTDPAGENRARRKHLLHARLSEFRQGEPREATVLIVKTADRLANLLACDEQKPHMRGLYRREHEAFRAAVFRPGLCDALWERLAAALEKR
jgi:(p)ppGpp synthase/HD superfamily hydrolase